MYPEDMFGGYEGRHCAYLANMTPKRKAAITRKSPNQARRSREGRNGTELGHEDDDSNHSRRATLGPRRAVEDVHVRVAQGACGAR